jgi:hypothetical protein
MILRLLNDLELERHYRLPLLREVEERLREHIALEEGVFLESVRGVLPSGVWLMRHTHATAIEACVRLMDLKDDPEAFAVAVGSFRASLATGIEREEREVFRALEEGLTARELELLGDQMIRVGPPPASGMMPALALKRAVPAMPEAIVLRSCS